MTNIALPPPPDINNHPLVDNDRTMTRVYSQWFFNVYNILQQASIAAPAAATYVINTANAIIPNAQVLANLSTGFAKVTNGSGLVSTQSQIQSSDLANTSVNPGTYGSATQVPILVVNSKGQLTSANNVNFVPFNIYAYSFAGGV